MNISKILGLSLLTLVIVLGGLAAFNPQVAQAECQVSSFVFTNKLQLGSKGADVTALQGFLTEKGFLVMPRGVAPGTFGAKTQVALKAYQRSIGLQADGVLGTRSREKINTQLFDTCNPGGTSSNESLSGSRPLSNVLAAAIRSHGDGKLLKLDDVIVPASGLVPAKYGAKETFNAYITGGSGNYKSIWTFDNLATPNIEKQHVDSYFSKLNIRPVDYTFESEGKWQVSLYAIDDAGSVTARKTITVNVVADMAYSTAGPNSKLYITSPLGGERFVLARDSINIRWAFRDGVNAGVTTIYLQEKNNSQRNQLYGQMVSGDPTNYDLAYTYKLPEYLFINPGTYSIVLHSTTGEIVSSNNFEIISPVQSSVTPGGTYTLTDITGLQGYYSAGQKITLYAGGLESDGTPTLASEQFHIQAHLYDAAVGINPSFEAANAVFDTSINKWKIELTAPRDPSIRYEIRVGLYCGNVGLGSYCAQKYGSFNGTGSYKTVNFRLFPTIID